jgi:phosphatidate phosphatase PAH1
LSKIFIINPESEIFQVRSGYKWTYKTLNQKVDHVFPPIDYSCQGKLSPTKKIAFEEKQKLKDYQSNVYWKQGEDKNIEDLLAEMNSSKK